MEISQTKGNINEKRKTKVKRKKGDITIRIWERGTEKDKRKYAVRVK